MDLPTLRQTSRTLLGDDGPSSVERLLRQAVDGLGGGDFGRAALLLFGLAQGTRGIKPTELRELAAGEFGVLADTFRKDRERRILEAMAQQLLGLLVRQQITPVLRDEDPAIRQERLGRLVSEIEQLSAAELGQLLPILAERLGVPEEVVWKR